MTAMTVDEETELDAVRWKLDRLARRRMVTPLSSWEAELYRRLTEREIVLLEVAARSSIAPQ